MTAADTPDPDWVPLADFRARFRGPPNGDRKAWWWTVDGSLQLDDVLFGADGVMDGKGGCGADFCTHIRLVGVDELPQPPTRVIPSNPRGIGPDWHLVYDFQGMPTTTLTVWWWGERGGVELDEVRLDAEGAVASGGSLDVTHLRLVRRGELPAPPTGMVWRD